MVKVKQLGHVVIKVRDLEKAEEFYSRTLGLRVTNKRPGVMVFMSAREETSHELALVSIGQDALGPDKGRVGLYHFAWEMESFEDLNKLYVQLKEDEVPIGGIGDHGISIGVYFFDPDGNEIEAFYETSRENWPEDRDLFEGAFPQKLGDHIYVGEI